MAVSLAGDGSPMQKIFSERIGWLLRIDILSVWGIVEKEGR